MRVKGRPTGRYIIARLAVATACMAASTLAAAGDQKYEPLSASVQAALHRSVADQASPRLAFASDAEGIAWLAAMSKRMEKHIPDAAERINLLTTVHYEATRAGLDPQLVLGVIQVESYFRKYAISKAGARGYMQVMPFWVNLIGDPGHNLFKLKINLRYGCTILRHYLDMERGDTFRALGRYNGSLGKSRYPSAVRRAWVGNWGYKAGDRVIATPTVYAGESR